MSAIIFKNEEDSKIQPLLDLAKKLGLSFEKIPNDQWESHLLARQIDKGMKTKTVDKEEVMKALMS